MNHDYCSDEPTENYELPPEILTDFQLFRQYMDECKERRRLAKERERSKPRPKAKSSKKSHQQRAKTTPVIKWLKDRICPFIFGEKIDDNIWPSVKKEHFIARWNQKLGQPSLANYKLLEHFQGVRTLYCMGDGWEKASETLVMIDIDVLKSNRLGSPEGARRFAAHIKTFWPNMYFEPSTNGKGMHGYFVLAKRGSDATTTNSALKRFERWLRHQAKVTNADIELVEVKGTCFDMTFDEGRVQSVSYGSLAKLPRDVSRFAEWEETTVLRVRDLESSVYDLNEDEPVVKPEPVVTIPFPQAITGQPKKKPISCGSITGKVISDDELANIPKFEGMYREWVGSEDLMAGKFRVTAHDFAVAMVLLRHFRNDPNSDGSLPTRRAGELWTELYLAGDVQRGWNHHRWKVIRDFLSSKGHINWKEHRYEIPRVVQNHEKSVIRGIACKWAINDDFADWLQKVANMTVFNVGGASFVDTKIRKLVPSPGSGQNLRPIPASIRHLDLMRRFEEASHLMFAA